MIPALAADGVEAAWIDGAHAVMHAVAVGVGILGVAVLVWGILVTMGVLLRAEFCRLRGEDPRPAQSSLREVLGTYLLLGLEILVAADIVETIIAPSLEALAVLGAIVAIRTIISLSLNYELKHAAIHAQRRATEPASGANPGALSQ